MSGPWIAVDLDGTLAHWDESAFPAIGPPIPVMVARVQGWITEGKDVRIFTARVGPATIAECAVFGKSPQEWRMYQIGLIENFCIAQFGVPLAITCAKDFKLVELWDDRAVQMETNTGRPMLEGTLTVLEQNLQSREYQILSLCGIVGAEAEEELEEKVRALVEGVAEARAWIAENARLTTRVVELETAATAWRAEVIAAREARDRADARVKELEAGLVEIAREIAEPPEHIVGD